MAPKSGLAAAPMPIGGSLLPLRRTKVLSSPIPLSEKYVPPSPPLLSLEVLEAVPVIKGEFINRSPILV